jgi:hypothetical protein
MTNIGPFILVVLKNTPLWVWALLAYLILQGTRALKGGPTSFTRLSIMPIAFAIWGLWGVFEKFHGNGFSILAWLASVGVGTAFGMLRTASLDIIVDRRTGTLELPGSAMPLISSLLVFAVKYALSVLVALRPETLAAPWFLIVDVGITGLFAGLLAGRLFSLWRKYKATEADPVIA